jgi:hypothetical protein
MKGKTPLIPRDFLENVIKSTLIEIYYFISKSPKPAIIKLLQS